MSQEIKRQALLSVANLVRPALARGDYLPALQHIRFDGKFATSFNDISAIAVRCDLDVKRCLPGELLIRALQSFNADSVAITQSDKEVKLSSGRSNLKVPTLDVEAFPLQWPKEDSSEIELTPEIVKGISRCLMNVGNDPTHPECMGVTLDQEDGRAVLFSTDNFSLSRYTTADKIKLPGSSPVILPTFFCEQLVSLCRVYAEEDLTLFVHAGALVAEFGSKARIFTRTLVDKEPLDFPAMIGQQLKGVKNLKKELVAIPDAFDAALNRALLVLEQEADKYTTFSMAEAGFSMSSKSAMGEADDVLRTDDGPSFDSPEEVFIDPSFVMRGAKTAALLGFLKGSFVMADKEAQFVHLVAYCEAPDKKKK